MQRGFRDYVRDFFTNWNESDAPFAQKLATTFRNRMRSFGTLHGCCGHHGEPGC